jgi:hypothetical protein
MQEYCAFGGFFAIVFGEADPPGHDWLIEHKVERVSSTRWEPDVICQRLQRRRSA